MTQFTEEQAKQYEKVLQEIFEDATDRKEVVEDVLERFENANLASEHARERIAGEIVNALEP